MEAQKPEHDWPTIAAKLEANGDIENANRIRELIKTSESNPLEAAMRDLKQQILNSTERNPLDLSQMISSGPANDGSLNLITQQQGHLTDEAKEAIRIVVEDLPKLIPAVELMQGKALRLRTGEWLLSPLHFSALKLLLQ